MVVLPRILQGSALVLDADAPVSGMSMADFVTGMLLTALVPAAIWCAILKLADIAFRFDLPWQTFAGVAVVIATFLGGIYTCLVRNA